ncbi:MAG: DUF4176 domain-containing protein [Streptococcaceae bacterium]|jgi:hypothetical protein|nr:DUF4176 domain-containing protein [Streptococcaceae bacterium]
MAEIKEERLLPVGSVVYLKEGTLKVVILARGQLFKEKSDKPTFYDYLGSLYPQGFDQSNSYYFNKEQIAEVIFSGYYDDEEGRYLNVLGKWKIEHKSEYNILSNDEMITGKINE